MGATATAPCEEQVQGRRERRRCMGAGTRGVTLGQLLTQAHEAVHAHPDAHADCPVCGGVLEPHALEARCGGCGSRLA